MTILQHCVNYIRVAALTKTTAVLLLSAAQIATAQNTTGTLQDHTENTSGTMTAEWIDNSGAMWIWPAATGDTPNAYVQVAHEITLPPTGSENLELAISADSNYAVWMNGAFAGFGQWSNFPDDKTYDLINLAPYAQPGANRLCIEVYHQGESSSTYLEGPGGVMYAINAGGAVVAVSGVESRMRQAPDYVSGPMPKVTGQLGFTFEHRADKNDGWRSAGYAANKSWNSPADGEMKALSERPVRPRPVAKLKLEKRATMRIASQGVFTRKKADETPAELMQSDSLAWRKADRLFQNPRTHLSDNDTTGLAFKIEAWAGCTGPYIVLDVGREEAGLLELELDAPEGTIFDVGYGEHLEDLRVRTSVGGRNFAVRYVSSAGHQTFLHPFLRLAGRYIQVQITPPPGSDAPVILQYAGLRPTPFPVEHVGRFDSPDSLHNRIWEVSRRTLELCMHEHYEDCPWREQALYAMDARNQALAGYYCFGNYDFAAASIKLLGQGMKEDDGFLELCAPARVGITIPSFSLAWILMLDDYMLFSGDREFVESQLPIVDRIIQTCSTNTSGAITLTPKGPRMWNFYEWAPGLDGNGVQGYKTLDENRLEAPLNLFYLLALDAATTMARETGQDSTRYEHLAQDLRSQFADTFWDDQEKAFRTRINDGQEPHFAELTQALAILAGVVPDGALDSLRERLAMDNNRLVPCTISHTLYKFEALLTDKEKYAPRVFDLIKRDWGYMLGQGATSFWETIDGASAFGDAGSLCHGWSGIPAWFYGAYVLGVKPTAPGFATYELDPVINTFHEAAGIVPTPTGSLDVKWHNENGKLVQEVRPMLSRLQPTDLLKYHDKSGAVHDAATTADWNLRRAEILESMQQVMGSLPGDEKRCPLDVRVEEEVDCGPYVRRFITYASEPDCRTPAYLLIPKAALDEPDNHYPAVLALHSTQLELGHKVAVGLGGGHNRDYARGLAERGFVVISPSYPLMADYQPDLKSLGYESGTMKAIWDNIRAIDLLQSLPYVDTNRVGVIGHSLGGHNALFTAAFEQRIKAIVSSCGFDSFAVYKDGDLSGWTQDRYMPRIASYQPGQTPFDFHEVLGVLAPRPVFVSAPLHDDNFKWQSVDEIAAAAQKIYSLYRAGDQLQVIHPDCAHDIPDDVRDAMFQFMEKILASPASPNGEE